MGQQLTFSLSFKEALEKEDFFFSQCNLNAAKTIGNWEIWNSGVMILVGPKYAGKTHLCTVWAKETDAFFIDVNEIYEKLNQCLSMEFVCIEDIDNLSKQEEKKKEETEEALFHLINHATQRNRKALFSARKMPHEWSLNLKDLESRMLSFDKVLIEEPDDKLVLALLMKLFNDRQVAINHSELNHIALRIDRSYSSLYEFVKLIDQKSLALQKKINSSLINEAIEEMERNEWH